MDKHAALWHKLHYWCWRRCAFEQFPSLCWRPLGCIREWLSLPHTGTRHRGGGGCRCNVYSATARLINPPLAVADVHVNVASVVVQVPRRALI